MRYIWLIPLLPGLGAAVNGLVGIRAFSRRTAGFVACALMTAALGLSLLAFWQLLGRPEGQRFFDVTIAQWIPPIPLQMHDGLVGRFQVPWGFRLDPLAGMMLLVVTGIGTLIHVYSTAYMADEPRGGVARFFAYLNLFCFFMLMLVLGNNFLVMFVGWEGVGLCSYLLIGYWYEKKTAADAGKKAFIANRIGDWGFILGIFLIFYTFGTLDFRSVQNAAAAMPTESMHLGVLSAICLLLFVGAFAAGAFHLMTHAFFKALLFLGSGSVIHAVAGEQDMRRMGGLKQYMPITFTTMMIGTLAIAGIPPFAGFFSKDEILYQAFQHNALIWALAVVTALMTAFYMFRLMSMTFFGAFRGPGWEAAGHGHGHGAWHGPHESPTPMTFPLMVLAVGAIFAGMVGIPAALGGGDAIEHF